MKILFTGRGTSGSWQIRGVQIGAAMGAEVEPMALRSSADVVVAVKRVPDEVAQAFRGRMVWDVVDAFPQPHANRWSEAECKIWLAKEIRRLEPVGIIAATKAMAEDCAGFDVPVLWLPHHHRPGIAVNPIRERIEVVGYEGGPQYIDGWRPAIEQECQRIGARLVVNPESLADVDVVLALRTDAGYAPRLWKSNVKLSNAHGSGTPFIGCREAGYLETKTGFEEWADDAHELGAAFDRLETRKVRQVVQDVFLRAAFTVEEAAAKLRAWLVGL